MLEITEVVNRESQKESGEDGIFVFVIERKKNGFSHCKKPFKRQKGVEPSSSAWKAEIMSRYMTAADDVFNIHKRRFLVNR